MISRNEINTQVAMTTYIKYLTKETAEEANRQNCLKYYHEHKHEKAEKISQYKKQHYQKNKEKILQQQKEYYQRKKVEQNLTSITQTQPSNIIVTQTFVMEITN